MNLHEYQAKKLFSSYGIPVPQGNPAATPAEAGNIAEALGGNLWVIKAQAHTGGRGKAGGVSLARSLDEVKSAAKQILGKRLITRQSGPDGLPVNQVLIEKGAAIVRELYLGMLLDRAASRVLFMASEAGGMNIEEVASQQPERIITTRVNPAAGLLPYQCRKIGFSLRLDEKQIKALTRLMQGLYRLYLEKDASLIEINPLIVTADGELVALDAKINIDGNALFRQPEILALRDPDQEDPKERLASEYDLNYITLQGQIGCMVNGAGLAMATMDLVKLHGGQPANFLDVGGGATAERVSQAFRLILSDPNVRVILINIFGGIVRCDLIAEGIITAAREVHVEIPVVVRLEGTNAELGLKMLHDSDLRFITAGGFSEAALLAVKAAAGEQP